VRIALALILPVASSSAASKTGRALPGQIPKTPPALAGFPIPFHRTTDYRPREGKVLAADLEHDGNVDLVLSLPAGILDVIRSNGTEAPGWPHVLFGADLDGDGVPDPLPQPAYPYGAPGVGDLDGVGAQEIVTCVVSGSNPRRSFLFAFHADGSTVQGWPVELGSPDGDNFACSPSGVLMADLDGDGRAEVVRAMTDGTVRAYAGNGGLLWRWPPDGQGRLRGINADLAAADLDGDGGDEVIVVESGLEPRLVALSGDGQARPVHVMPGFPRVLLGIVDQQAPAVSDLDGRGHPDVVQSTRPFTGAFLAPVLSPGNGGSPESLEPIGPIPPAEPAKLHVIGSDGSDSPGWPRVLSAGGPWGAVVADLTGDGRPEILQEDGDLLYAFDAWGAVLPGFPFAPHRDFLRADATLASPWRVADLDGDSTPDLLQARSDIYSGSAYLRLFGLRTTGQSLKGFPFEVAGLMAASDPVVVDLSGDGVPDLVILATEGSNGSYTLLGWDLGGLLPGQAP